ncbi:MAG TPA: TlpA disulfide reductase family protein [Geminicoccaceae bacterium]|nr:TlpA disulfide reductase family protein [Geminicoccaceae bacterium]
MSKRLCSLVLLLGLAGLALPGPAGALELAPGTGQEVPDLRFFDLDGNEGGLADFHGRAVVLNLWATWCAPCREEMPSLDRLQAMFPKERLVVLALSVDRAGPERVQAFLDEIGVTELEVRRDPKAAAARSLKVPGLPATILIDAEGREVGRLLGIAEWDGPEAVAVVRKLLESSS